MDASYGSVRTAVASRRNMVASSAIGLLAALALMALLIVVGVLQGLSGGSADQTANKLTALTTQGRNNLNSSKPPPEEGQSPEDLNKAVTVTPLDPTQYVFTRPIFSVMQSEDTRWRKPDVLAADQFDAALVRVDVPSYYFTKDLKSIFLRVPKEGMSVLDPGLAAQLGKKRGARTALFQPQPGLTRPGVGVRPPGAPGAMGPGSGGAGSGMAPGMTPPPGAVGAAVLTGPRAR